MRLLPLLQAAAWKSLKKAVEDCQNSYRAAWGLLREYQRKLGVPLVRLERSLRPAAYRRSAKSGKVHFSSSRDAATGREPRYVLVGQQPARTGHSASPSKAAADRQLPCVQTSMICGSGTCREILSCGPIRSSTFVEPRQHENDTCEVREAGFFSSSPRPPWQQDAERKMTRLLRPKRKTWPRALPRPGSPRPRP